MTWPCGACSKPLDVPAACKLRPAIAVAPRSRTGLGAWLLLSRFASTSYFLPCRRGHCLCHWAVRRWNGTTCRRSPSTNDSIHHRACESSKFPWLRGTRCAHSLCSKACLHATARSESSKHSGFATSLTAQLIYAWSLLDAFGSCGRDLFLIVRDCAGFDLCCGGSSKLLLRLRRRGSQRHILRRRQWLSIFVSPSQSSSVFHRPVLPLKHRFHMSLHCLHLRFWC